MKKKVEVCVQVCQFSGHDLYMHLIYYMVSNYVLVASKMSSRNITTKLSPRAPKIKEVKTGKGSSPGAVR